MMGDTGRMGGGMGETGYEAQLMGGVSEKCE